MNTGLITVGCGPLGYVLGAAPMVEKTPGQVRKHFDRLGMSVARWARENECSAHAVYQVLYGKHKGVRGEAHRVAVLLGIKDGIA